MLNAAKSLRKVFAIAIDRVPRPLGDIDDVVEAIQSDLPEDRYDRPEWRREADACMVRLGMMAVGRADGIRKISSVRRTQDDGTQTRLWRDQEDLNQEDCQARIIDYCRQGAACYAAARELYEWGTGRGYQLTLPIDDPDAA